jgi:hypothetical protein
VLGSLGQREIAAPHLRPLTDITGHTLLPVIQGERGGVIAGERG